MDSKQCHAETMHKPVAWTPDDGNGIAGVCACGRFVWTATPRESRTVAPSLRAWAQYVRQRTQAMSSLRTVAHEMQRANAERRRAGVR